MAQRGHLKQQGVNNSDIRNRFPTRSGKREIVYLNQKPLELQIHNYYTSVLLALMSVTDSARLHSKFKDKVRQMSFRQHSESLLSQYFMSNSQITVSNN